MDLKLTGINMSLREEITCTSSYFLGSLNSPNEAKNKLVERNSKTYHGYLKYGTAKIMTGINLSLIELAVYLYDLSLFWLNVLANQSKNKELVERSFKTQDRY